MPIGPPQRLTPQFCSPGTQRDPRAPKGRGVSQRKSQRVEDGEQENKRERERKLPWGVPLQPITPAGLLSLWVHTASDCPPPSLSSLPIHTEIPSRFHCFQGCAFTLLSEKCFSEILSFSVFVSFLTWQNFCSRWNFSIGSQWSDCCINTDNNLHLQQLQKLNNILENVLACLFYFLSEEY